MRHAPDRFGTPDSGDGYPTMCELHRRKQLHPGRDTPQQKRIRCRIRDEVTAATALERLAALPAGVPTARRARLPGCLRTRRGRRKRAASEPGHCAVPDVPCGGAPSVSFRTYRVRKVHTPPDALNPGDKAPSGTAPLPRFVSWRAHHSGTYRVSNFREHEVPQYQTSNVVRSLRLVARRQLCKLPATRHPNIRTNEV